MIYWIFGTLIIVSALIATVSRGIRSSALALWVCGLGVGAFYITIGAEFLAIIQWVLSTLIAVSFVFFGVMFGEYGRNEPQVAKKALVLMGLGIALGVVFVCIFYFGLTPAPATSLIVPATGNDFVALSKMLVGKEFVALHVLCLSLFLVLVGGGVLARPDSKKEGSE